MLNKHGAAHMDMQSWCGILEPRMAREEKRTRNDHLILRRMFWIFSASSERDSSKTRYLQTKKAEYAAPISLKKTGTIGN